MVKTNQSDKAAEQALANVQWHPDAIPPKGKFVEREELLVQCRAAWNLRDDYTDRDETGPRLHFRLSGPPGSGKNAIVYELARKLAEERSIKFYSMVGHEEMTPEDLSLVVVPSTSSNGSTFEVKASPLATAIRYGGVFFLDEINRIGERALSPLSSVLDDGHAVIYSAVSALKIEGEDDAAKRNFFFCCAMNPNAQTSGHGLPEYISQRTIPVVNVPHLEKAKMKKIIELNATSDTVWIHAFIKVYDEHLKEMSARQILALMNYAVRSRRGRTDDELPEFLIELRGLFFRQ